MGMFDIEDFLGDDHCDEDPAYWVTRDGQRLRIADLAPSHVCNILNAVLDGRISIADADQEKNLRVRASSCGVRYEPMTRRWHDFSGFEPTYEWAKPGKKLVYCAPPVPPCQACKPVPGKIVETDDMRRCAKCGRHLLTLVQRTVDNIARIVVDSTRKGTMKTFWVLWNPLSKVPPQVRFSTQEEAEKIAAFMARRHNATFYVLKAETQVEVAPAPIKSTKLK